MSILPWEDTYCDPAKNGCGGWFKRLPTQRKRITLCPQCRPVRRNPPVRRRR